MTETLYLKIILYFVLKEENLNSRKLFLFFQSVNHIESPTDIQIQRNWERFVILICEKFESFLSKVRFSKKQTNKKKMEATEVSIKNI